MSFTGFYAKKGELARGITLMESEWGRESRDRILAVSLSVLYIKAGRIDDALSVLEESDRLVYIPGSWKCGSCGETFGTSLGFCRACCSFDSIDKDEASQ